MTPDFTLIWPLSCLKDGVHLWCAVRVLVFTFLLAWVATRADAQANYYYTAPVADFTTPAGSPWTAVPSCSLAFTPGSTSENWVVMATGQVSSSSTSDPPAAHVRLRVGGIVEGEGGVQNSPANAETGFFMMDLINSSALQNIDVQAQDPLVGKPQRWNSVP